MRSAGSQFEDIALAHAQRDGLQLITRNFSCRYGEIDLVMRDRQTIVFVEVRYRRSQRFGGALDSVGSGKRSRLVKAASVFLQSRPELAAHACRFDLLAIAGNAAEPSIEWHRNAFET